MTGLNEKYKELWIIKSDSISSLRNRLAESHKELTVLFDLVTPLLVKSLRCKNVMESSLCFATTEKNVVVILRRPSLPSGGSILKTKESNVL